MFRQKTPILLLLFALILSFSNFTGADEKMLELKIISTPQEWQKQIGYRYPPLRLSTSDTSAEKISWESEPSDKFRYFTLTLGKGEDNKFTCALSGDTLYADSNNDNLLADDEKIVSQKVSRKIKFRNRRYFGKVKFSVKYGEQTLPYYMMVLPYSRSVEVMSSCLKFGRVKFGETECRVRLIDTNHNGLFNDKKRDSIRIDVNRNGKIVGIPKEQKAYPNSKYVVIAGECYQLNISPNGSSLQVMSPDLEYGVLKLPSENFLLLLRGKYGIMYVEGKNYQAKIPVGNYQLRSCVLAKKGSEDNLWKVVGDVGKKRIKITSKDAKGNLWEINGELRRKQIKISSDSPTNLDFGPPLSVSLSSNQRSRNVNFNIKIEGAGGEIYSPVVTKNKRRMPAPSVKIRDKNGRSLGEHSFQYG